MTRTSIRKDEILFGGETVQRLLALARNVRSGARPKKMSPADIEAELLALAAEKAAVIAALEANEVRRAEAVLDGVPFAEIRAIEDEGQEKSYILEQLEAAEGPLRQRLHEAVSDMRRADWKRHAAGVKAAAAHYLEAAKIAEVAGRQFLKLREDVGAEFREISLLAPLPVLPGGALLVDRAILANWEFDVEKFFAHLPDIDAPRGKAWDGADQPARNLDYRTGPREPAPIFGPQPRPAAPAAVDQKPQRERRLHAPAAAPNEQSDGKIKTMERRETIEMTPDADGLVAFFFARRFELADGDVNEPGNRRVTPGVALAALNAGAGDLAPAETMAKDQKEALHG